MARGILIMRNSAGTQANERERRKNFEKHGDAAASRAVTLFTLFIKHFRHLHK